jgi:hypothetical protein
VQDAPGAAPCSQAVKIKVTERKELKTSILLLRIRQILVGIGIFACSIIIFDIIQKIITFHSSIINNIFNATMAIIIFQYISTSYLEMSKNNQLIVLVLSILSPAIYYGAWLFDHLK